MSKGLQATLAMGILCFVMSTKAAPAAVNGTRAPKVDTNMPEEVKTDTSPLELFEGDIKISRELVMKLYNFSSIPGGEKLLEEWKKNDSSLQASMSTYRLARAAGQPGISINLWTNNIVPYSFSSSISKGTAKIVRDAMDSWEDNTCLRFVTKGPSTSNYIDVINSESGCYSYFGRKSAGKQDLNLQANSGCEHFGVALHEIGHAIGFLHEQSRPDRDDYVTINFDNIEQDDSIHYQFMKQNNDRINSLGSTYDYGSIMHYSSSAFSKPGCSGQSCETISVNNQTEYSRQGSPTLGQRSQLSSSDIAQAKSLYNCQDTGVEGFLLYRARYGRSLEDTDPAANDPDPYIKFTSIDLNGNHHNHKSSDKSGTRNPNWNEWVPTSERRWNSFRVQLWDEDSFLTFGDDSMSVSETFVVEPGQHSSLKHCDSPTCSGYAIFDYRLLTLITGKLQFYIRYARSLDDTDPIWNDPDPYVRIEARQSTGGVVARNSGVKGGTTNPTWNEWINYNCQRWAYFEIQIWDDDDFFTGSDDDMSSKELVFLQSGHHNSQRHNANGNGYLIYDYNFIVDGNECSPNPCRNGGTCIDECSSYRCSCRSGYTGTNCQYHAGSLSVYARYGRNLPDEDGWWNDSDPYMEFIAVDQNGNEKKLTTSVKGGDQSPDWNQNLSFGYRSWNRLKVKVYDSDNNADDALSSQVTYTLPSPGISRRYVTLNCYSGYVVFDYTYQ